jgi:hypothetical protein
VVPPEVPGGCSVGQAVFGDKADGPLLDATGVLAVGQGQVGNIGGEATATVEAAMAGERDHQIDGAFGPSIAEVVEGARANGVATGAVTTARAGSRRPIAAAPLDAWLGQVFDVSDALGDIRDILPRTSHRRFS